MWAAYKLYIYIYIAIRSQHPKRGWRFFSGHRGSLKRFNRLQTHRYYIYVYLANGLFHSTDICMAKRSSPVCVCARVCGTPRISSTHIHLFYSTNNNTRSFAVRSLLLRFKRNIFYVFGESFIIYAVGFSRYYHNKTVWRRMKSIF